MTPPGTGPSQGGGMPRGCVSRPFSAFWPPGNGGFLCPVLEVDHEDETYKRT